MSRPAVRPTGGYRSGTAVSGRRRLAAWAIHAYTAGGLVLAAAATALAVIGDPASLRSALLLLWVAGAIDATDGWLARRVGVAAVLPRLDGRRLDDIVDFHTYTSVPLLLIWRAGALPPELAWLLAVPLLASLYGFSQAHAKTPDGYFLGFPSYWNVVAFYLLVLAPPVGITAAILVTLALLTFVPAKYLYPSRAGRAGRTMLALGAVWALAVLWILAAEPAGQRAWALVSLAYPAYYMVASWTISLRDWRGSGRNRKIEGGAAG